MSGELILYTTEGRTVAHPDAGQGGTVWVTQAQIAELFQTTPQNITLHIKAIYAERELLAEATWLTDPARIYAQICHAARC